MAERRQQAVAWALALGLVLVLCFAVAMVMGAAGQNAEVLQVDVAAWIDRYTTGSDANDSVGIRPVRLFLAVTSSTRGVVEQLRGGNVRVYDALRGPGGESEEPSGPETVEVVSFSDLGGGFYQVNVAPWFRWNRDQYVLRIEVECPWGRGIALCELPMGASDMTLYE